MAVEKFSISLPGELVADVESIAEQDGRTRSAVIREATARYVADRKSTTYEAERRRRIAAAIEGFNAIADAWGPDERSGLSYLREIRGDVDVDDGATSPGRTTPQQKTTDGGEDE